MLLGEISTTDKWILGCTIVMAFTSLCALVVAIVAINKKQDVSVEQPVEIQLASEFVHKSDFEKHVEDNNHSFAEAERKRSEDLRAASMSRKGVYDKIDETRAELTEKIDNLPDRVISILRNFGVIGHK